MPFFFLLKAESDSKCHIAAVARHCSCSSPCGITTAKKRNRKCMRAEMPQNGDGTTATSLSDFVEFSDDFYSDPRTRCMKAKSKQVEPEVENGE